MVKVSDAIDASYDILKNKVPSARFEAELVVSHVLQKDRLRLLIDKNQQVSPDDFDKIKSMSCKRACGVPLAYITGKKEFMSLEFKVNSSVLIPRPETEELVSLIIGLYKGKRVRILDLCTGSGAICCALAHYLGDAICTGADISADALTVARENAQSLGVSDRCEFVCYDVLNPAGFEHQFDIVVSNPPYIESHVIPSLEDTVKNNEPIIALDGGADGLSFYRKITNDIDMYLKTGGMLFFEIGYNQGEDLKNLMTARFNDIKIIKDLSGNDRIASGRLI